MPRSKPHRSALFSLVPQSELAWAVLDHPDNRHLVSAVPNPEELEPPTHGINVGFNIGSKSRYTLATLGRNGADITVEAATVSRIQCSFEIHETTEVIMLYDRSASHSTQFYGSSAVPFEPGRTPRRVVVQPEVNLEFGFGGVACDLIRFRLVWHGREFSIREQLDNRDEHPCYALTIDETTTLVQSQRVTRIHTPSNQQVKIRYLKKKALGKGSFGEVFKAVNIDAGEVLAVKRVGWPPLESHQYILLKREVEALSRISHPNIVEYVSAQAFGEEFLDIVMELKDGSVQDLIRRDDLFVRDQSLARPLLHHVLKALDYLQCEGIIHRDVKPENVLYTPVPDGGFLFQLTDFGVCNTVGAARTYTGSAFYIAPELENGEGAQQTTKMDIWSLFVTLTYALNTADFRMKPLHQYSLRVQAVQEAASDPTLRPLQDMASIDPRQRASAADILDRVFGGEGRTSSHKKDIPPPQQGQKAGSSQLTGAAENVGQEMPSHLTNEEPPTGKDPTPAGSLRPRRELAARVEKRPRQAPGHRLPREQFRN